MANHSFYQLILVGITSKPSFAFYFGKLGHGDKDYSAVEKLMGNVGAIFSIYFQEERIA